MKAMVSSLPLSIKLIFRDPINIFLAVVPTILALALYLYAVITAFKNTEFFTITLSQYIDSPEAAGWAGKALTALLILFVFLLMSWTFVIVVGILAAPFNSMLSSRIERHLVGAPVETTTSKTLTQMGRSLGHTFVNEAKKLVAIIIMGILAFLLNLIPLFYPVGLFLVAILIAVQFVDYSWSRHEMGFSSCLKDTASHVLPYAVSGGFFLIMVTIPLLNTLVPALATSYYTVLWLERNKKLPPPTGTASVNYQG